MQLILIFISFLTYFGSRVAQSLDVAFVYNSIPYQTISLTENKGSSNDIKIASEAGIAVVGAGFAGIMIIDKEFQVHTQISPDNSYIQSVQITKDARYVFAGMNQTIGVFAVNNSTYNITQINTISIPGFVVSDIQFYTDQSVLFAVGYYGSLNWYDIRNPSNIILLGSYVNSEMIFWKGLMSPNPRIFYLVADQDGLLAFQIDKSITNNQMSMNLTRVMRKPAVSSFVELTVTSKNDIVYAVDRWNGVFILSDLTSLVLDAADAETQNDNIIQMIQGNLQNTAGYTCAIGLSSDDQYLYIGARSLGIMIYSTTNPLSPTFFQQLQITGQSVSLRLSPKKDPSSSVANPFDNEFIYYSNSLEVVVYQKQTPSLFRNVPNLFNSQQTQFYTEGHGSYKWRCHVSQNNKYLIGAFDADSLCIFNINIPSYSSSNPATLQLQYQFSDSQEQFTTTNTFRQFGPNDSVPLGFFVDTVQFTKDEQYMYFASSQYDLNVIAYKFQVIKSATGDISLQYVKGLQYDQVYYCEEMNLSVDEKYASMSFDVGVLIVDVVQFEVISMYQNTGVIGTCCGAVLSHDNQYLLGVVRNVGLFVYNTANMTNLTMVNSWRTNGGETLIRSKTDKIIYFVDGFNGIRLIDSSKLPEIVVVGTFIASGWSNFITLTLNEDYGIISTMDTGTLTVIDLNDKTNPRIIMKSTIQNQDSQTTCVDSSGLSFAFSNNHVGIRLYPLQSQVMIHVEREVMKTSTQNQRTMDNLEAFKVGETYLVRFVSLFRASNQVLQQIYYYNNLIMNPLPSWMIIDNTVQSDPNLQSVLQITIPKEALGLAQTNVNFIILVIQTCFQLNEASFIYNTSDLTTTATQSQYVFLYLKSNGYIDGNSCATDFFDPTTTQYIDLIQAFPGLTIDPSTLTQIEIYVSETVKRSIAYNQFIFNVESSLTFSQKESSSMISAVQNQITLSLSFPQGSPFIFIQKMYPDLVMYYNSQLTQTIMQGNINSINEALKNGILYFDQRSVPTTNTTTTYSGNSTLSVGVADNYNYDLSYSLQVPSEAVFLKEKKGIILNSDLQNQVNKQYSGGQLTIESSFLIEFDKLTFTDPDGVTLTYQFLQEVSGQYVQISTDSFIKYDNINLRLVGSPPSSLLFTNCYLRLVASNGYNTLYADFTLQLNIMPFTYILNILIQVLGPLAFVFGVYKKRSSFMNVYFKENTMYSTEVAYVNQLYRKKIAILDYDYEVANQFFYKFMKVVQRNQLQKNNPIQLEQLDQENGMTIKRTFQDSNRNETQINTQQLLQIPMSTKRNDGCELASPIQSETLLPQGIPVSDLPSKERVIKSNGNIYEESKQQENGKGNYHKPSILIQQKQIDGLQNPSPVFKKLHLKQYIQQIKFFQRRKDSKGNVSYQKEKGNNDQEIEQTRNNTQQEGNNIPVNNKFYQFLRRSILSDNGQSFNMDRLFNMMIDNKLKIQFNLQNYTIENYANELQNNDSRFYTCLKSNVIRYMMENDKNTLSFYNFLKRYAVEAGEYLSNDWYKMYVAIVATNELDKNGVPLPFSRTYLKEDSIFYVSKLLQLLPTNMEREKFEMTMLMDNQINPNLLKEGLNFVSAKSLLKCRGESLHQENHTIVSVEGYQIIQEGVCLCLRKPFNMQYQTLPISKFISLPTWMSYDYKNGVIILEGIPSKQDVNQLFIRVYDKIHFACYQFHLKIEDNPNSSNQCLSPALSPQQNNEQLVGSAYDKQMFFNNSDHRLLIMSQTPLNKNKSLAQQNSNNTSIFKNGATTQKEKAEANTPISERNTENKQSDDFQAHVNRLQEFQGKGDIEEEEDETYAGIKSTMDFNNEINTTIAPPVFPQMPQFQGNGIPDNLKLNFQLPATKFVQQTAPIQKNQNLHLQLELPNVKKVNSFCDKESNISSNNDDETNINQILNSQ